MILWNPKIVSTVLILRIVKIVNMFISRHMAELLRTVCIRHRLGWSIVMMPVRQWVVLPHLPLSIDMESAYIILNIVIIAAIALAV